MNDSGLGGVIVRLRTPPSSSIAAAACSSDSAFPCQPSALARSDTPCPFSVRATIIVGRSAFLAWVYAASIAATSWPSISIACHPNASARSRNTSACHPCIVGPRWPSLFRSRIAVRPLSSWNEAVSMASQIDPSAISESPSITQTCPGEPSSRNAYAIPTPIGSPWPSDPVATSTHGSSGTGAGCPWIGDPNRRSVSISSSEMAPIAFSAAYRTGAAWPFESTNRSFARSPGSPTFVRR